MSNKKAVQDYFKASLDMNTDAMAKDFADDIEIQNITPHFTRYIYGINQFKRSATDEASNAAKKMLAMFDNPKQEIKRPIYTAPNLMGLSIASIMTSKITRKDI